MTPTPKNWASQTRPGPSGPAGSARPGPGDGPEAGSGDAPQPDAVWAPGANDVDVAEGEIAEGEILDDDAAVEHDIDELLVTARRERDEYLDMLRRVQADFENYKKRMIRQQTDHLERAAEGVVVKLLPTLDAFDLAREHLGEGDDLSAEGKALIQASALLADTLAKEGLERIDDVGAPFDPTMHDAVDRVSGDAGAGGAGGSRAGGDDGGAGGDDPSVGAGGESDAGADTVVDAVLRTGYRWKGRVIRPAMVRVRG